VANEIKALENLCSTDEGKLLIHVLQHGPGSESHLSNDLYQIDMELCVQTLEQKIREQPSSVRDVLHQLLDSSGGIGAGIRLFLQLSTKIEEIIKILSQILEGLVFIHSLGQVHRDLKPENGSTFARS